MVIHQTAALLFLLVIYGGAAQPSAAQRLAPPAEQSPNENKSSSPLEARAKDVCALFRNEPPDYVKLFNATFLAQVSEPQLTSIFRAYFARAGRCTGARLAESHEPNFGRFQLAFENGDTISASLTIEDDPPHLITGLFIGPLTPPVASLPVVIAELKALPGVTNFLFARLEAGRIAPITAHNPDKALAIGSTFQLYILSELLRAVRAGECKLSGVVPLDGKAFSLPSGLLQDWPPGSPVTLYSLAALMISQSDNTAADQLLGILGRERVERIQAAAGHSKPKLNQPFLTTLEMFKLKAEPDDKVAAQYLALDEKGRRVFLAHEIAARKRQEIKLCTQPSHLDSLEWFASAADLCRAMNYLREKTEGDPRAKPIRQILAINPGLEIQREKWRYAGFKGGSEPGVINMTYLLQSTSGTWYALSMTWNNSKATLDESKFSKLMQRALQVAPIGP